MCEKCKVQGTGPAAIELALTVTFENGVKEIPFRAWSDMGGVGLHILTDAKHGEFVKGFLSEALPMIIDHLDGEIKKEKILQ